MTDQTDCTLPTELFEQIDVEEMDAKSELPRILICKAMRAIPTRKFPLHHDLFRPAALAVDQHDPAKDQSEARIVLPNSIPTSWIYGIALNDKFTR